MSQENVTILCSWLQAINSVSIEDVLGVGEFCFAAVTPLVVCPLPPHSTEHVKKQFTYQLNFTFLDYEQHLSLLFKFNE